MFTTVAEIEAFLGIEIDADSPAALRAIEAATAAIRNYTGQHIAPTETGVATLFGNGTRLLFLPELPVVAVAAVDLDGDPVLSTQRVIRPSDGTIRMWRNISEWESVAVTYSYGYAETPVDIRDIATRAASRVYQAALRTVETDGVSGIASTSLGDYSIAFQSEQGGGAGDGASLGASGARPLLLSECKVLDRYRIRNQL